MKKIIKRLVPKFVKRYIANRKERKRLVTEIENTISKFEPQLRDCDLVNKKQQILCDCNEFKCTPLE